MRFGSIDPTPTPKITSLRPRPSAAQICYGFPQAPSQIRSEFPRPTPSPQALAGGLVGEIELGIWEGEVLEFLIAMASVLVLGSCTTPPPSAPISAPPSAPIYTRTDGKPIDAAQEQATLARCKGEGVSEVENNPYINPNTDEWKRKEATIINACMARNGYIQAQQ